MMSESVSATATTNVGQPLISVVCPVYCEEPNVRPFYERLSNAVEGKPFSLELIFINDGSKDASLDRLRAIADADPRVVVLTLTRNFGSYPAISAGLHRASGDAIAVIAVDLQDPPDLIPKFVDKWLEGADVVWGVRNGREDGLSKKLFARIFYWLLRKTAFPDFPSEGTDCGLFDRRVIDVFLRLPERNSIPFLTIFAFGFPHVMIPYRREARVAAESGWPFWKRVKGAIDAITSYSYAPIRAITAIGGFFSLLAFLGALVIVYQSLFLDLGDPGWPSLAVLILFFGGLQIILLGVASEYIWRANEQVRKLPKYIVMEQYPADRKALGETKIDPDHVNVSSFVRRFGVRPNK